jgi:protein-S-isoprenylcysteine O-methyltransferase Ste14
MKRKSWVSLSHFAAVLLWGALTGLRLLETARQPGLLPLCLAAQSGLAAYWLVFRRRQTGKTSIFRQITAWVSALLPLALHLPHAPLGAGPQETVAGQILTLAGLGLVLWALASLGPSFGIAPADRGLVTCGPYRWVRHPMYLGELIAVTSAVLGAPSPWNSLVLHTLLVTLLLRIRWEECLLYNYATYAGRVRWRLIPYLW